MVGKEVADVTIHIHIVIFGLVYIALSYRKKFLMIVLDCL